jgi:iron complex transport system substrate-binding protein
VVVIVWGLVMAGCAPSPPPAVELPKRALRIVSLDYCADQFVMKLADREHVLALSPDAGAPFSYMRDSAAGYDTVLPRAENVLILEPDVVVRAYGGGPKAAGFFARSGVPVIQIGLSNSLDEVRATIRRIARALGVAERGEAIVARMDARLAAIQAGGRASGKRPQTLYTTPSGFTAGPGTLVDEMLRVAGLANFQQARGWRQLPLERLAYQSPQLVAFASFGMGSAHDRARTPARHPVARRRTGHVPVVPLDGATTSCGGWFLLDAVETLAAGAGRAEP